MAEVVLRDELARAGLAEAVEVDSAGTGDWHVGGPMDRRARAELARHGYDGSAHRARQFQPSWFGDCDLVLAMDRANLADLRRMAPDPDGGRAGAAVPVVRPRRWPATTATTARCPTRTVARPEEYARRLRPGAGGRERPGRAARRAARSAGGRTGRPVSPAALAGSELAERLDRLTGTGVREVRPAGCAASVDATTGRRWPTAAGCSPRRPRPTWRGIFEAEARGLRWLAEARDGAGARGGRLGQATLVVSWVPEQDAGSARGRGGSGATWRVLHAAGAPRFGAPWPGFIASLPLGDRTGDAPTVAGALGDRRLGQLVREQAAAALPAPGRGRRRARPRRDARLVEPVVARLPSLAGPPEPPSRIHGDCWSGNVLWSGGRGWLIDPAAQGGHRETDLAMLALFGAPYLDRILAGYEEVAPLAPGWRDRVPLHQLHPLLVHACLFGGGYAEAVRGAARAASLANR